MLTPRSALGALALWAGALSAATAPALAAPPSLDAGAVSIGHPVDRPAGEATDRAVRRFDLPDGGSMAYLSLGPADWGQDGPPAFRVYVLPGSGCKGLAPIARAYFRGLRAGEVVVPHKRHVRPEQWATPMGEPSLCTEAFTRHDTLQRWSLDARAFVDWHLRQHPPRHDQPVALVGVSEGAELLAAIAADHPGVALLATVGSTGLDPLEALEMQARREGAPRFVEELLRRSADSRADDAQAWAFRNLGYWRSLAGWRHSAALLEARQPLWMGFGELDAAVPLEGFERFLRRARAAGRPVCAALFPDGDHGLQHAGGDEDLQRFWSWLADALVRRAGPSDCAPLKPQQPPPAPGE